MSGWVILTRDSVDTHTPSPRRGRQARYIPMHDHNHDDDWPCFMCDHGREMMKVEVEYLRVFVVGYAVFINGGRKDTKRMSRWIEKRKGRPCVLTNAEFDRITERMWTPDFSGHTNPVSVH